MEKRDFYVGARFLTDVGEWICVDVGLKYVYAIRSSDRSKIQVEEEETSFIVAFDHYDFGACTPVAILGDAGDV